MAHPTDHILLLPVEIIEEILAHLPLHTLLLASQTCRPLRKLIHDFYPAARDDMLANAEPKEILLYLTHLSRLQPDRWVCAKCFKLHRIHVEDSPYDHSHVRCTDGSDVSARYRVSKCFGYTPMHRHVQLTLKYVRLGSEESRYQEYLESLGAVHYRFDYKSRGNNTNGAVYLEYVAYPRVVDGKYLLLSIWTYGGVHYDLNARDIYCLDICPHFSQMGVRRDYNWGDIQRLFVTVFATKDTLTEISCDSCKTDFIIERSPRRFDVAVWQDFGSEGTIFDAEWGSLARDTHFIHHQPQSVRHFYGPLEHQGKIYE
ncbi:hypothetical protein ACQKWADRAFT_321656 [Trichoderma austrokoningii]